jgi:hypothetical protein
MPGRFRTFRSVSGTPVVSFDEAFKRYPFRHRLVFSISTKTSMNGIVLDTGHVREQRSAADDDLKVRYIVFSSQESEVIVLQILSTASL